MGILNRSLNGMVVSAGIIMAGSTIGTSQAENWPEKFWNPKPSAGDRTLPMPCGGTIVFRPVETPHGDRLLDDRFFELGEENGDYNYLRGRRDTNLSGSFTMSGGDTRGYFLAKYELAKIQYDVVMAHAGDARPVCKEKPKHTDFLPITNISWFDAITFGKLYTEWLFEHAPESLPMADGVRGFVRLPTEAEWEFAARGGALVETVAFRASRFPLGSEGLNAFAATSEAGSANGRLQPIGTRKANPLGLHDIYGNASEIVLEPFRLTRMGRLHGQTGGLIKKGGDARTTLDFVNSGSRQEIPFFDDSTGKSYVDRFMGVRPAIAAIVFTSQDYEQRVRTDVHAFKRSSLDEALAAKEREAIAELDDVAGDPRYTEIADTLRTLKNSFDDVRLARNEQAESSVRSLVLAGAAMCARIENLVASGRSWRALFDLLKSEAESFDAQSVEDEVRLTHIKEQEIPSAAGKGRAIEEAIRGSQEVYAVLVDTLALNHQILNVELQADLLAKEYQNRPLGGLLECLPMLTSDISARTAEGHLALQRWDVDFSIGTP